MINVIKREKAHFRIDIRDLKSGKVRTISLSNNSNMDIEQLKEKVIRCFDLEVQNKAK